MTMRIHAAIWAVVPAIGLLTWALSGPQTGAKAVAAAADETAPEAPGFYRVEASDDGVYQASRNVGALDRDVNAPGARRW
jgi:hypothetical protein